MKQNLAHLFLWGGLVLTVWGVGRTLYDGVEAGVQAVAIAGAIVAAAGLISLRDRN